MINARAAKVAALWMAGKLGFERAYRAAKAGKLDFQKTAIITQLERIADSLEGIANCVEYVMPTEYARQFCPDAKGYYRIRIGGEVYGND